VAFSPGGDGVGKSPELLAQKSLTAANDCGGAEHKSLNQKPYFFVFFCFFCPPHPKSDSNIHANLNI
jgi:hypothetical protein